MHDPIALPERNERLNISEAGEAVEAPAASAVAQAEESAPPAEKLEIPETAAKSWHERMLARIRYMRKRVGHLVKLAATATAIATFGVAAYVIAISLFKTTITIDPISTPKALAENGFTSEVTASELKNAMTRAMSAIMSPSPQMNLRSDQPDVTVPTVNVSALSIASSIRKFVPFLDAKVISGEVIGADDKLYLSLRLAGTQIYVNNRGAKPQQFKQLLEAAAPVVLRKSWPLYSAIEMTRNNPEFALESAKRVIKTGSSSDVTSAYLIKGTIETTTGACREALRSFDTLLTRDSRSEVQFQGHVGRAFAFKCRKQDQEFNKELEIAIALAKDDPIKLLMIHAMQEMPPSILISDAHAFLAKHGSEAGAYDQMATMLGQLRLSAEAIKLYEIAIRLDPEDIVTRINLGSAYLDAGRSEEGYASYRKAVEINPHDDRLLEIHLNLANKLREERRLEDAETEYRAVLDTPLPTSFRRYGSSVINVLPQTDVHIRARNGLASVLREQKKLDTALVEIQKNVDLEPRSSDVRIELALIERDQGKTDNALEDMRQAIKLDPNSPSARFYLGSLLRDKGDLDEAIEELERSIRLTPNERLPDAAPAHDQISLVKLSQKKYDEAEDSAKRAIELGKRLTGNEFNRSVYEYTLVQIYRAQDKDEKAINALKEAIRLYPDGVDLRRELADMLIQRKELGEAIAQRRIVLQKIPDNARISFELAATLQSNGELEEARQIFQKLYDQDSQNSDSIFNMASITTDQAFRANGAERLNLMTQACKLLRDGLKSTPRDRDFLAMLGKLNQLYPKRRHCSA